MSVVRKTPKFAEQHPWTFFNDKYSLGASREDNQARSCYEKHTNAKNPGNTIDPRREVFSTCENETEETTQDYHRQPNKHRKRQRAVSSNAYDLGMTLGLELVLFNSMLTTGSPVNEDIGYHFENQQYTAKR